MVQAAGIEGMLAVLGHLAAIRAQRACHLAAGGMLAAGELGMFAAPVAPGRGGMEWARWTGGIRIASKTAPQPQEPRSRCSVVPVDRAAVVRLSALAAVELGMLAALAAPGPSLASSESR